MPYVVLLIIFGAVLAVWALLTPALYRPALISTHEPIGASRWI
jgi:hypothetical protein